MKISAYIFSTLLTFNTFVLPHHALAQVPESEDIEETAEPCTAEESEIEVQSEGEITFVSGGIGSCEAQEMRRLAGQYPLGLVFVQKNAMAESFLASIPVEITDTKGNKVLSTTSTGPILLAKLPPGRYTVTAKYNDIVKSQQVVVSRKHRELVYVWKVDY